LAKTRMDVAHEVRLAKEAEATMELHVARAGQKIEREAAKHEPMHPNATPNIVDPADRCVLAAENNTSLN
jgi:hypothetical protein